MYAAGALVAAIRKNSRFKNLLDLFSSSSYHWTMNIGRRSFFKRLGAVIGSVALTPQARLRAQEIRRASEYVSTFQKNSLKSSPSSLLLSGQFNTFHLTGQMICVSGRYWPVSG